MADYRDRDRDRDYNRDREYHRDRDYSREYRDRPRDRDREYRDVDRDRDYDRRDGDRGRYDRDRHDRDRDRDRDQGSRYDRDRDRDARGRDRNDRGGPAGSLKRDMDRYDADAYAKKQRRDRRGGDSSPEEGEADDPATKAKAAKQQPGLPATVVAVKDVPMKGDDVVESDDDSDGDAFKTAEEIAAEEERQREERRKRREAIVAQFGGQPTAPPPAAPAAPTLPSSPSNGPAVLAAKSPPVKAAAAPAAASTGAAAGAAAVLDMFDEGQLAVTDAEDQALGMIAKAGDDRKEVRAALTHNALHHHDWDDAEGYYKVNVGELIEDRYKVLGIKGRGVFSTVLMCRDLRPLPAHLTHDGQPGPEVVAMKLIRANDTMRRAGNKEIEILRAITTADREDRHHCVRMLSSFEYRGHLCLVFESLRMNLKEVIDKFGKGVGLNISAVRSYGKQMLAALHLLDKIGVVHADIKPHNMLVNETCSILKLADFGSAFRYDVDADPTPYLVSRFYRAPEVILGLNHTPAVDMWSVGCVIYEVFTGHVMFNGDDNNDMLWLMMQIKGRFPNRMIRRHFAACEKLMMEPHFTPEMQFIHHEIDPVSGAPTRKHVTITKVEQDLGTLLQSNRLAGEDKKSVKHLQDLLEKIFTLDPSKRISVKEAMAHPFFHPQLTTASRPETSTGTATAGATAGSAAASGDGGDFSFATSSATE